MAPITVNWEEVFSDWPRSPEPDVGAGPKRARGATRSSDDEWRRGPSCPRQPHFGGLVTEIGRRVGERRPRAEPEAEARLPRTRAAGAKAAADLGRNARSADDNVVILNIVEEDIKPVQASLKSAEPPRVPKEAPPEEIFQALKAISRLSRSDLLRAYSMLTRDDRLFRSLMALPQKMRKEWLLMEIGRK